MLAFVVGLKAEARLLTGAVHVGGGDAAGAARAAARAIETGATALVSFGLAGGLSPSLRPGALVVPGCVLWQGRRYRTDAALNAALGGVSGEMLLAERSVIAGAAAKAEAYRDSGADAVDLESGAVAEAASLAGLPFAALRAVCDPAWRSLPPASLLALDGAGAIGLGRVFRSVAQDPSQIGALLTLARDAASARRALAQRISGLQRPPQPK